MADQRIANNSVDAAPESGVAKRDAHTVGPWKVLNGHVYAERFIRDTVNVKDGVETPYTEGLIALVYTPMPAEPGEWTATSEANRRLIAAAPDLLAFVREVADLSTLIRDDDRERELILKARRLLAKAGAVLALVLFIATSAHAADRTPLASLIAASVADAVTTERAIARVPFAYEANPLLTGSALKREASKAACTAGLVWGLARLGRSHPRLATALAWTATGSLAALAAHNAAMLAERKRS